MDCLSRILHIRRTNIYQSMNKKGSKRSSALLYVAVLLLSGFMGSCFDSIAPGNYYTFTGQTIADFLEENEDEFSDFMTVLKRAKTWGELDTYGQYTCFAPTNSAIQAYLESRSLSSVDDLSDADCDTITWTHLIDKTYYMSDMSEGALPSVNLNDRFLTLSYDSVLADDGRYRLRYCINKNSHIIQMDDTVQNGVVQVVDSVIKVAGEYVFDVLKADKNSTIFFQALNKIGLEDSLKEWRDNSYYIDYDSVYEGVVYQGGGSDYRAYYWGDRKTNFTILVEPDSVFHRHGIMNLEDLEEYAKTVYHESYPADGDQYDSDYTDRRNPLNRFISYHIMKAGVPSSANFNYRSDIIEARCELALIDPEDYFEMYMPHSIIRVSTVTTGSEAGVYVNRRGIGSTEAELNRPKVRGVRILNTSEMTGVDNEGSNGYFHYIDDILVYSKNVREDVLNRRMRIDCVTLSPDFITSGARQKLSTSGGNEATAFKQPTNFHSYTDDYVLAVRCAYTTNWSYEGDGVDLQGNYDLYLKLPPVPFDGTWELRLSYRGYEGCGIVQNYVGTSPQSLEPCGIPTDLTISAADNHNIGWETDEGLTEEEIQANDKAMHNRGYMKGPDSHRISTDPSSFRQINTMARRIVTTQYFYADQDYYLRMKLVLDNPKAEMNFDYMEWCPKSIYDNGEDRH